MVHHTGHPSQDLFPLSGLWKRICCCLQNYWCDLCHGKWKSPPLYSPRSTISRIAWNPSLRFYSLTFMLFITSCFAASFMVFRTTCGNYMVPSKVSSTFLYLLVLGEIAFGFRDASVCGARDFCFHCRDLKLTTYVSFKHTLQFSYPQFCNMVALEKTISRQLEVNTLN